MSKLVAHISMSLDGFIAGPDISEEQPMGKNGLLLHEWIFSKKTDADGELLDDLVKTSGAVIVGNHTYTTAIDGAWEGVSPFNVPAFVVCHKAPGKAREGFEFITTGIDGALEKAIRVAGEKNIWLMGGANIIQQYLQAGLVDELNIHLVPLLLTAGTRLFENIALNPLHFETKEISSTPAAIHIKLHHPQSEQFA